VYSVSAVLVCPYLGGAPTTADAVARMGRMVLSQNIVVDCNTPSDNSPACPERFYTTSNRRRAHSFLSMHDIRQNTKLDSMIRWVRLHSVVDPVQHLLSTFQYSNVTVCLSSCGKQRITGQIPSPLTARNDEVSNITNQSSK
jgi:hypothetical protein